MDSYTITIAPNDDSGAATRLVVNTSGEHVRITDVHLHAPEGLSSGHIPTVDFDLLLQAVTGTVTAANGQRLTDTTAMTAPQHDTPALEAATQAEEQPTAPAPERRARKAAPRATATPQKRAAARRTAATVSETKPPRRSARAATTSTTRGVKQSPAKTAGKARATKTPPAPATKPAVKRTATPARNQAPAKRARAAGTVPSTATGRVYRRTPDDLAAVFQQVGTVAGIAAHYQVPRYTAQGWVSRLRATA